MTTIDPLVSAWLNHVAYVASSDRLNMLCEDVPDSYYSKFDDSYLTVVGLENNLKFLAEYDISEQLTHGVGFSPTNNKWYGWSHRAIYGFSVGSTCKKGDCHYTPEKGEWVAQTMEDAKQMAIDFNEGVS